jgi:hypothetical protein
MTPVLGAVEQCFRGIPFDLVTRRKNSDPYTDYAGRVGFHRFVSVSDASTVTRALSGRTTAQIMGEPGGSSE